MSKSRSRESGQMAVARIQVKANGVLDQNANMRGGEKEWGSVMYRENKESLGDLLIA